MKKHTKKRLKQILSTALCMLMVLGIFAGGDFAGLKAKAADRTLYCGIDVSKHNGDINWKTAKKRGVDFAIVRCYCLKKDEKFENNYAGALNNDIAVGAYVFMYAETAAEARQEAQGALDALGGKALDFPLFLDVEYSKVRALGKKTLTDLMLIELEMFREAGYKPGIYTSLSYIGTYMDKSRLTDYVWWVARWTCEHPNLYTFADENPFSAKKPSCDLWQFSDAGNGSFFGMSATYVDLNFCYRDFFERLIKPEPTTQPAAPEPTTQPAAPEPTTQPAAPEPTTQPVITEPATQPVITEPATQPVITEPATQPVNPEPTTQAADPKTATQSTGSDQSKPPERSGLTAFFEVVNMVFHFALSLISSIVI